MAWIFDRVIYPLGGKGYTTIVTAVVGRNAQAVAMFRNGGRFVFPCTVGYYSRHLLIGRDYEEDVTFVLGNLYSRAVPAFLDCGAHFGYWSTAVSAQPGMADRVVAVEPSQFALPFLWRNQSANACRFQIEDRAIWSVADRDVGFSTNRTHPSSGISHESWDYTVRTTTVDSIVERRGWTGRQVAVKLDVEGAEIAAFAGAEATSDNGSIFIYEDHGRDRECRVTGFLLKRGWIVHFVAHNRLVSIVATAQLANFKEERHRGYNLVAWRRETELSTFLRSLASSR